MTAEQRIRLRQALDQHAREALTRRCLFCDKPLQGPSRTRKYCSDPCRQAFWVRFTDAGRDWMRRGSKSRRKVAA